MTVDRQKIVGWGAPTRKAGGRGSIGDRNGLSLWLNSWAAATHPHPTPMAGKQETIQREAIDVTMIPTIRLEVDAMRYSVVHAFADHQGEVKEAVERALDRALNEFDIDRVAYDEAMRVLDGVVKDAVKHAVANQVAREISKRFARAFDPDGQDDRTS